MNVEEFEKRIEQRIYSLVNLRANDRILVGVSGGADSVALLAVLARLRGSRNHGAGIRLNAIHVEHGIRGDESLEDQSFVRELCVKYDVPLVCRSAGKMIFDEAVSHLSLEERARDARYALIQEEAVRLRQEHPDCRVYIALAHHGNDNAETVLFNMIRGTGLDGMRGIPARRDDIIRPMLSVTRADIERYLSDIEQCYRTDSTNRDSSYDRNNIRLNILPALLKINSGAVEHINASAVLLTEISGYIELRASEILSAAKGHDGLVEDEISIEEIVSQPPFMRREVLHLWLSEYIMHAKDVTAKHLHDMQELMGKQVGRRISLPGGHIVHRTYAGLRISGREPERDSDEARERLNVSVCRDDLEQLRGMSVTAGGKRYEFMLIDSFSCSDTPMLNYTKWFDYDKMKNDISIRNPAEGDYMQVYSDGGCQSFNKYCRNAKIPSRIRCDIPLICDGNHIVWAVGYRISEKYKVHTDTRTVLEIRVMEER